MALAALPPMPHNARLMLTGKQIQAALSLLGWTYRDLAEKTGVGVNTVVRLAKAEDETKAGYARTWHTIRKEIEAAGVEFIDPDKPLPPGGPGVRLRGKE